jgi:tetratricopeptide (TPR) repeat protein
MMMRVRVLTPIIAISILIISACTRDESAVRMPVTTDSELALELYETGLVAYDQLKGELAWHNFQYAIREDPDFFMAHYWMYFLTSKTSKKVAEEAFQSDCELNSGEELIRTSLKYLVDGQDEKVVESLKMVVDLYPLDPHVHKLLYLMQLDYMKDNEGAIESMKRTIEVLPEYSPVYNYLGYAYMYLEEWESAEEALDNYIRLAPTEANPYDSKGDFYMNTKQFGKAYESYMKAYEIDSSFAVSKKKAIKARQMMEKVTT